MDKRELELLQLGKHVDDNQTVQMAPYPINVSFITSCDEWDGLMMYINHLDPNAGTLALVGELKRSGPSMTYVQYNNESVYVLGIQTYDPSYTVDYYPMLLGTFAKLVQRMIMDYADRIGHDVQPSANPSGAIIDWALRQWMAVLNNRYNRMTTMLPGDDFRLGCNEPELTKAMYKAYQAIGATAVKNALQRECHALLNHVVTPTGIGWQATTYLTGGDK